MSHIRWVPEYPQDSAAPQPPPKHLDGVRWDEAPMPRRWHRCTPQTWTHLGWIRDFERCACGAIRELGTLGHGWRNKNSRRVLDHMIIMPLIRCPSCWERSVNPGPGGYRPGECLGCGRRYV